MTNVNVTLPVALMLLDPERYPTISRAKRAARKGSILIQTSSRNGNVTNVKFDARQARRGKADYRVGPHDIIAKQVLMPDGVYFGMTFAKPPIVLPVMYEDDHVAVVNKPAGVPVFADQGRDSVGDKRKSIERALPYALQPPCHGTVGRLLYPQPCHRLDLPTCGLLVVAKTRPALIALSRQFEERKVRKTYTAVLNGMPRESDERRISAIQAHEMGVDVDFDHSETNNNADHTSFQSWQLIDEELDGKSAITLWRKLKSARSKRARDNTLTAVEFKLKTGRYHQLRRHMAWVVGCPIVGDTTYEDEKYLYKGQGMFLCSNKVRFEHPYFNTTEGKKEWSDVCDDDSAKEFNKLQIDASTGVASVHVYVDVPDKFVALLEKEESRFDSHSKS